MAAKRPLDAKDAPAAPASGAGCAHPDHRGPLLRGIAEELAAGAIAELDAAGASYERIVVPGALEIPQALAQAVKAGLIGSDDADARFDGCVALGCVIRGETSHYDIVCNNANHWLMQLAVENGIPLGNAILTVDTEAQALERAAAAARARAPMRCAPAWPWSRIERVYRRRGAGMSAAGKRAARGSKAACRAAARGWPPCRRSTRWTWPRPISPP